MRISKHFSRREAEKSQTATRFHIDNKIPDLLLGNVIDIAENVLEPIREAFCVPFSPSSWYRSEDLCLAIGSKTTSQHAKGEAVDIKVPGVSNLNLAKWIVDNLNFDQLILEYYKEDEPHSGWVHVSYKKEGNRKQVLRYDGINYLEGLS